MPAVQPVPPQFNTAEFRRSNGPREHNSAVAWSGGHSGRGVTIAIVDSGVDPNNPEFAGRVSPLSRDVLGADRPIAGSDDHGTHVALVAAASRNGTGVVGMAYDATIMALRTDSIGSCGSDAPEDTDPDCSFPDSAIAAAIDHASANGAKVINVSLGGDGAGLALRNAVAAAANRGSLVVLSAGNDGLDQPDTFARLLDQAAGGGAIIVGSVNAEGQISSFSNKAGSQNAHYMTALGERICCSYENGQLYTSPEGFIYLMNGTSFSAPQVSGAAALLAQAFPNLTGRQIAQILLETAFDAGVPGTDLVYGRGILDLARAFQPIGATSLANGRVLALADGTGAGSPAMGDALSAASLQAIVLDRYERAFEADLAGTLRGAQPAARLGSAVGAQVRHVAFASPQASVAMSIDASNFQPELPRNSRLRLTAEDAGQAQVLAARVTAAINPGLQLGFAYREEAEGLSAQLQGYDQSAFLIAPSAGGDDGSVDRPSAAVALRQRLGPWGVTLSAEHGEVLSAARIVRAAEQFDRRWAGLVASYGLAIDRRLGALQATLGINWRAEDETLLGGRFHEAFGVGGADTLFLDARAGWHFAPSWRFGAALRQGWTHASEAGLVASGSRLASRAWSLDLARRSVLADGDSLALRLSQPLRVESGTLNLSLPVAWNYATMSADYRTRRLGLAPEGRELVGELAWQSRLRFGGAGASLFYRRDPGHYQAFADDVGAALKWSAKF
jgi:hypothetical protein